MPGRTHQALRRQTQPLHDTLDAATSLSSLTRRDGYVGLLLANWPCVAIEQALEHAGVRDLLPDWNLRRRRFDLAADLAALEVPLPAAPPLAIATDAATILGWSYVLEGSRLGAKLMVRTVETGGSAEILKATRFLTHGRDTNFWGSFKTTLASFDDDPDAIAVACSAASTAFECFIASAASSRQARSDNPGAI